MTAIKLMLLPVLVGSLCFATLGYGAAGGYKKATEGEDVVKNKLYPKKGKVELNGPNFGTILNQSYIETYMVNAGINYFWSEVWGLGLEFSYAINKDRNERKCVETFYNDPNYAVDAECGSADNLSQDGEGKANFGPAYVNIREYNYIFSGNLIWNPIYGKEIFFMSGVGYFDVFTTLGAGLAMTTFYPMRTDLPNGRASRGDFPVDGQGPGAGPDETDEDGKLMYGDEGRPVPVKESKILIQGGVGQKFHFGKNFNMKIELRDHLVVGTPGGFDNVLYAFRRGRL